MIAPFIESGWQFEEVRKFLKAHEADSNLDHISVHLVNPSDQEQIDHVILHVIFPHIEAAFKNSPMSVLPSRQGRAKDIRDVLSDEASRELEFCVADPSRPIGSSNQAPWFLRGNLTCSLKNYTLTTEFHLSLPTSIGTRRLLSLLKHEAFRGNPPELHYEEGRRLPERYVVRFYGGEGMQPSGKWKLVARIIEDALQQCVAVVEAMYALEKDYSDAKAFRMLVRQLAKVFEAT